MQTMYSNRYLFFALLSLGALSSLLLAGCASRGSLATATMKISESKKAISIAREGAVNIPATVELKNAESKQSQADQAFADKRYLAAARLAEKATVDADCARIETNAGHAQDEAEQMQQNIDNLRLDIERTSR